MAIELDVLDGQKEDAVNNDEYELAAELREMGSKMEEELVRLAQEPAGSRGKRMGVGRDGERMDLERTACGVREAHGIGGHVSLPC